LASRHHSLDLSEVADITDMLCGFEAHNSCRIEVRVETLSLMKGRTLVVKGMAWNTKEDVPEAKLLASVSVTCSALNLRNWNSVLTHLMYALDFQLALQELEKEQTKKA